MHNHPLTPSPHDPLNAPDAFDLRVVAALERQPAFTIPADFAARVAARIPATAKPPVLTATVGRRVALLALAALVLAITLTATSRSVLSTPLVWSLSVEFLLIVSWLGLTTRRPT